MAPATEPQRFFQAVALDLDGTLAHDGAVAPEVMAALDDGLSKGLRVIIVTGRTLEDLDSSYPGLRGRVTAVVAENGAVVASPLGVRELAKPVEACLGAALDARGVPWASGRVLMACSGADEASVAAAVRELGLDYELVRNRGALMVLPPGVTKASGLLEALSELGLSPHNTVAVGDAENDHTMLGACELGVAVADAIGALRARADLVLEQPDGAGVAQLLGGSVLQGGRRPQLGHWRVDLGTDSDGRLVQLPASQLNLVVAGDAGRGKSYLTGLIAEQLVLQHYSLVVVDPEGDHVGLGRLPGVLVMDASCLAGAAQLFPFLLQAGMSVVIDSSRLDQAEQASLMARLPAEIEAERGRRGLPHWVVIDEAHGPSRAQGVLRSLDPSSRGYLMATYRPEELAPDIVASTDAILALGTANPDAALVEMTAAVANVARSETASFLARAAGRAVLAWRERPGVLTAFAPGRRVTAHHRHDHKYAMGRLSLDHRFYFRNSADELTGETAGSLAELETVLATCESGVLRHHCPSHDISRWVAEVLGYRELASQLYEAEGALSADAPEAVAEATRASLIAALHAAAH